MTRRLLTLALVLALAATSCGPTCIRAGGWGFNLEVCWEQKTDANSGGRAKPAEAPSVPADVEPAP